MRKLLKLLPLVLVASLTACDNYRFEDNYNQPLLVFGTVVTIKMQIKNHYNGLKAFADIIHILEKYDELADTKERENTNVYTLNHTNEKVEISEDFYYLLKKANELKQSVKYFNPLMGSLSNKWKVALNFNNEYEHEPGVLTDEIVQEELAKINSSELVLEETEQGFYAQRNGEALIDLGAMAKGYALDKCVEYLSQHTAHTEDYLINAGNSSILLGKNSQTNETWKGLNYEDGIYVVNVKHIYNAESNLRIFNSYISTSGISEQNVKIGEETYSHIINPTTGNAISNYDQVVVINGNSWGNGVLGDALSTSLMMSSEEEIKEAEKDFEIKVIATKNGNIVYKSDGVTLYY